MDIKYIDLKFKSNNKEVKVGKGKPFRLLSIEGLSSVQIELSTSQNILNDGSKIRNKRVSFRPMMIECEYNGYDKESQRRFMAGFFNVHNGGTLQVDYMGVKREIPYEIEGYLSNLENLYEPFKFLVHLKCPEPYLLDLTETIEEIVTWKGGLTFPLRLPTRFAMAGEKEVNVYNSGDVEAPATFEIIGPAINPRIQSRETGEFIQINGTLTADDVLTITTGFGNKRVELNGENAFNLIQLPGSTFINLDIGDNVIELKTDDVASNAKLTVSYKNRYIGV